VVNPFVRIIPPFLVRAFARPYVAGDSLGRALDVAAELLETKGLLTTLDLLAEDIDNAQMAQRNLDTYLEMVEAVAADPRFETGPRAPTLSLKLSSYTTAPINEGGNAAGSREAALRIVERAAERGVRVTIDMESSAWTNFTLDLYDEIRAAGHRHVGTVLQSRLNRTEADLERIPEGGRVRLVIGIYNEPASIATTDKTEMKERLLTYGKRLIERGIFVELATHDEAFVRRFMNEVVPAAGVDPSRFEIQMLYGVPRDGLQSELRAAGVATRLYVPFALGWPMAIAYLRRRLDEYPRMMFLVAKNLFSGE
jgi:proline dehydrogenase